MTIHDDHITELARLASSIDLDEPILIVVETSAGTARVPCVVADLVEWLVEVHHL